MGFVNDGPWANFENVPYIDEYYSKVFGITTIVNDNIASLKNIITNKINTIIAYGKSTQNGTPTPESPVAIESVGELALWTAGRNLFVQSRFDYGDHASAGITWTFNTDGTWAVSGTTTTAASWAYAGAASPSYDDFKLVPAGTYTASVGGVGSWTIRSWDGTTKGTILSTTTKASHTFTLDQPTYVSVIPIVPTNTTVNNLVFYPQLELGSEATEYEPYSDTTTPIDLQGHQLRSLPDGTRDELTVDAQGNVTLTQRVGSVTFDGSSEETWTANTSRGNNIFYTPALDRLGATLVQSNRFEQIASIGSITGTEGKIYTNHTAANQVFNFSLPSSVTSVALLRTWLADNQTEVIYPLATPQTIDLGNIKLPNFLKYTTVWFATAEMSVSYQQSLANINSEFISHNSFTNFINALAEFLKTNIVENWDAANNCYEYAIGADALTASNNVNTNMAEITEIQPIEDFKTVDDIQPISPIEKGYN